jgi:hypothetical protein
MVIFPTELFWKIQQQKGADLFQALEFQNKILSTYSESSGNAV